MRIEVYSVRCSTGSPIELCLTCWFHGPRIISAASNVAFWTFFRAKTCCVVCHAYCFCYGGTNMARKNVWKPHSNRLLRWFNCSQSETRKTIEKPLKELPWNQQSKTNLYMVIVDEVCVVKKQQCSPFETRKSILVMWFKKEPYVKEKVVSIAIAHSKEWIWIKF